MSTSPESQPRQADIEDETPPKPPESLRRELWAVLTLYVVLSVLPLLIGLLAGP
jgi:hypothetical protein